MDDIIYVTKEGYEQYESILENINNKININNQEKSEAMKDAPGDGWHDNFAAEDAARVERRLLDEKNSLNSLKHNIKIIDNIIKKNKINIGDKLEIKFLLEKESDSEIVILTGKFRPDNVEEITINSEIGKAILHKKENEIISFLVNNKKINIIVRKV